MKLHKLLSIGLLFMLILSACGTQPAATVEPAPQATATKPPTATPIPPTFTPEPTSTPTPIPTPTLPFEVPVSKEGKGTIVGLVLHGKDPAPDIAALLCSEYDNYNGCQGQQYTVNTNEDGYYIFKDIVPGEYIISLHISSSIILLTVDAYTSDGVPIFHKDSVAAGQTLIVEPQYIYKDDLVTVSPKPDEKVSAKPTFKWNAYPGASYYELTVASYYSDPIGPIKVERTEYTFEEPLAGCRYTRWGVEAFDEVGNKISTTHIDSYYGHVSMYFDVENPDFSCELKVISPKDYAEVNGAEGVEFSWEPNPMATCYRITINGEMHEVDSTQTSYKVDFMPKDTSDQWSGWQVQACDNTGRIIASSDYLTLIVR